MLNQATRTTDTDLIIRAARIAENVARHLNATGWYAVALDDFSVLRSIGERALGADHPDTRNQLARWTGETGDILAARDQYAALLPVQKRILGPDHPATLASWQGLAQWTGLAGDSAAARDQFAALLPVRERVLAPTIPTPPTPRRKLVEPLDVTTRPAPRWFQLRRGDEARRSGPPERQQPPEGSRGHT
ncbi:tetratricopeptide repeat protein [Micromonospora parva]|uniref:Tetratricopeptide repeat protein n=1 Tax=Micromonospora parva TaxID=1464048 RepID=A0ABW6VN25_9ACTN